MKVASPQEPAGIDDAMDRVPAPQEGLCVAASQGRTAAVKQLIQQCGAAVNQPDGKGMTAVMLAVQGGHLDTAVQLALCGADLSQRDPQGRTAIELAVLPANREASLALLLIATAKFTRPLSPLLPPSILLRLQQWVLDRTGKNGQAAAVVRAHAAPRFFFSRRGGTRHPPPRDPSMHRWPSSS